MLIIYFAIATVFAVGLDALAESQSAYQPLSAKESEQLLDEFLPPGQLGRGRFAFTLWIEPTFSPGIQITMVYSIESKAFVTVNELEKPWQEVITYAALYRERTGQKPELAELRRLFPVNTQMTEIGRETAYAILDGFWRSVSEMSQSGSKNALKNDGTDLVEIPYGPDATLYQVEYRDYTSYLRIEFPGHDPVRQKSPPREVLDPIIRWMLAVREQFMSNGGQ